MGGDAPPDVLSYSAAIDALSRSGMEDAPARAERILVGMEERYREGRHRRE